MRKLNVTIHNPDYFIHIAPAPPGCVNRKELVENKEEFECTDKKTGHRFIGQRIDMLTYSINREPLPTFVTSFALNMKPEEAHRYLKQKFPQFKFYDAEVAFFLFKIVEIIED